MSDYRSGYGSSYALIVGINTYSDPRFMPLGQAESDAQSMADLLGGPPYNFEITQLLGAQATKSAILKALNQLRRAQPDDRVLVYFAGHGYTLSDRLGNEAGYLACADTVPEEDFTALELENVVSLTRHTEAKHIGFIFDACFSGQALGLTRAPSVTADKLMQRRAYQVISAGAGDQTVSDYQSMTGRLVEALRTDALMNDGLVTMGELGLHLQQTITSDSNQTQIPQFGHIRGSQGGDFVFFVDMSVRLPADLEDALRSNRPNMRMSGVVELIELAHNPESELSTVAQERLAAIVQNDPDERVRDAAQSYFDELDADREADEAQREAERIAEEARRRKEQARQSRDLTPASMRKPKAEEAAPPASTDATAPEPASAEVYHAPVQPAPTPIKETPAPAPAPVVSVSKHVEVTVPESKAAPAASPLAALPKPVLYGIGGVLGIVVIAVIALAAMNGSKGSEDNENDNSPTQIAAVDNDNDTSPRATNTPRPQATSTPDFAFTDRPLELMPSASSLGFPNTLELDTSNETSNEEAAELVADSETMLERYEEQGRVMGGGLHYDTAGADACAEEQVRLMIAMTSYRDSASADAIYNAARGTSPTLPNLGHKAYYSVNEFENSFCEADARIILVNIRYFNVIATLQTTVNANFMTESEQLQQLKDAAEGYSDHLENNGP